MTQVASLQITNDLKEIARVISIIEECSSNIPLSFDVENAIELSLDELLTNIISYGYNDNDSHLITVDLWLEGEDDSKFVIIRLVDDGVKFNPLEKKEVDLDLPLEEKQIGGLGIHLVKKLMDELHYERREDKNVLTLKKKLKTIKES
ncbi:MAG: ATP-binding protein [Ignavibacteriales bacterium]|jgi:anti-sigma regulatory factor (Ser/Thr protein kinase)|nr:ATP-binding protein [Ignavibacteriaceae bacterium]NLH59922.1 ATP-binding protein [Ignavibacteriales bacterium]HOJ18456.1 ATP-binding protein [Ignavibacteriaceae bacterium]HPO56160.1 ATP-binding protein [Ignavibacteriaceae bacterium]